MLVVGIWKNAIRRVSPGGPGKVPKKFEKVLKKFLWKRVYEMCDENMSKRREWLSKIVKEMR